MWRRANRNYLYPAALHGAPTSVIKKIYDCLTTKAAMKIVEEEGLMDIWPDHGTESIGVLRENRPTKWRE